MTYLAQVHFDSQDQLLLSFASSDGAVLLSLGPFRTICKAEEAASRLLRSARGGEAVQLARPDGRPVLSANGQRWRLPVQEVSTALLLDRLVAGMPTMQLDDKRPPARRKFDLSGPLIRLATHGA
jgi:hypothetical protein